MYFCIHLRQRSGPQSDPVMTYTAEELELIERMPNLRAQVSLSVSNVWIIQWLREGDSAAGLTADRETGVELHQWMEMKRPGWAHLVITRSKAETLAAIERATLVAKKRNLRPILHIETHGCSTGIEGSDGKGGVEQIEWFELRERFARLNSVTQFNLLVFMAACTGFAGIGALIEFGRAPALALVGSAGVVSEKQLLDGAKEFYRRLLAGGSNLHEMASEASREAGPDIWFEPEMFPTLARESLIDMIIERGRNGRLRLRDAEVLQMIWDQMMMTDQSPENRKRFKLDVHGIVKQAVMFYGLAGRTNGE